MNHSITYVEQDCFNRIKTVIENPKNNGLHITSIGNMIRSFENRFGIGKLSNSLQKLKTKYCETI